MTPACGGTAGDAAVEIPAAWGAASVSSGAAGGHAGRWYRQSASVATVPPAPTPGPLR
ncbi:MAG: hypothetical protein Q8J99_13615 [Sulfuritalea sp.]|nr:hypothetical protein [Sulfuritalea sp.]